MYGTEPNNIKNNFNNHKEKFIKGKHFFYLQGEEKEFKNLVNDIDLVAKGTSQLYLWTERGAVCRDCNGEPYTGYIVEDLSTGFLVWGCYDSNYDHLWTLEDVEEFIKGEYEKAEIEY